MAKDNARMNPIIGVTLNLVGPSSMIEHLNLLFKKVLILPKTFKVLNYIKLMHINDSDKHYLFSLLYASGIILFWRGIWEAIAQVPIIGNVFVSLFLGLLIITLTGVIYKEFDPIGQKLNNVTRLLHDIMNEAKQGKKYEIHYYDHVSKKHQIVHAHRIKSIEHNYIILEEKGKELFIPIHRISRIHHQGKVVWQK